MANKRFLGIGWIPVIIVCLTALAIIGTLLTRSNNNTQGPQGGNFTLTSLAGPVSLSDFRGKAVLMMFGFTHCPDICPTGNATLAATLNLLSDEERAQTQAIFISVDPDRDTPERLDKYTHFFHPEILGITGSKEKIDEVVKNYGGFYRMVDLPDSALKYTVDHSSRIYVIDTNGKLAERKFHNTDPKELAEAVRQQLRNKG